MQSFFEIINQPVCLNQMEIFSFPPHIHDDIEIMYLRKGGIEVTVDQHIYVVGDDSMIVVFPRQIHSYVTLPQMQPEGFMLIIKPGLFSLNRINAGSGVPSCPLINEVQKDADLHYVTETLQRFTLDEENPMVVAVANLALVKLWPLLDVRKLEVQRDYMYLAVLEYIAAHYMESITLDGVADALKISKYTLSRIFADKLNLGFCNYINLLRLLDASRLLRTTDLSITQICFSCGFGTQRTFNRIFRERFGETPSEMRKRWR